MSIYLDFAAATPLRKEVREVMEPYFFEEFGNPGSIHDKGITAMNAVKESRMIIARIFDRSPKEVIFTSGGTESNNLALKGIARANKNEGSHIITQQTEHPSILETCNALEREGFNITYLPVDTQGMVSFQDLERAITPRTILISIMTINNETGTRQDITSLTSIAKKHNILFHTDACQEPIKNCADLITITASKIGGPKGIGALIVKKGITIEPLIHGGGQEQKVRSGTENVASIVGFSKALELYTPLHKDLSNYIREQLSTIKNIQFNTNTSYIINITIEGVEGETVVKHLNEKGIYISTGSACHTGDLIPSHVLLAMGRTQEEALSSIRISLGEKTTKNEIDTFVNTLKEVIHNLRKLNKELTLTPL